MLDVQQAERSAPIDLGAARRLVEAISRPWSDPSEVPDGAGLPQISDYVIDRRLGGGGGGTVYHAILPGWNDEFAIKWLHKPAADERVANRAWRELDLAERLKLPDTPRVFEYGVHEGRIFIVSEMIEGQPVDEYCRDRDLSVRDRVELLVRICSAVQALNERGVIHRDLKPSNILVKPDGHPVVIDLGISALIDDDRASTLTAAGAAIGTVAFMAPEQARGELGATSIRTDIYSLGATACLLLTGATPHDVTGLSVLEAIRRVGREAPRSPASLAPALPRDLCAALDRAVDSTPENRFQSVAEFGTELQCWLDGRPGNVRPRRWTRSLLYAIRRRPARWGWGAAACLAVLGATSMFAMGEYRHNSEQLELLAELESKQAWIDEQTAYFTDGLTILKKLIVQSEFQEAGRQLGVLGATLRQASTDEDDELVAEFERLSGAFLADVIRAVFAGDINTPTRDELAFQSVRALYEADEMWDEARSERIAEAIEAIEGRH